jgi:hypothetical protein
MSPASRCRRGATGGVRGRGAVIRYTLVCAQDHRFEAWFAGADAFDDQIARGLVACAVCGDTGVRKTPMAPALRKPAPATPLSAPSNPVEKKLRALREKVEREADYVGPAFAREARSMHDGDTPFRPIWGEARIEEAKSLVEDGVPVAPLPRFGPAKPN